MFFHWSLPNGSVGLCLKCSRRNQRKTTCFFDHLCQNRFGPPPPPPPRFFEVKTKTHTKNKHTHTHTHTSTHTHTHTYRPLCGGHSQRRGRGRIVLGISVSGTWPAGYCLALGSFARVLFLGSKDTQGNPCWDMLGGKKLLEAK